MANVMSFRGRCEAEKKRRRRRNFRDLVKIIINIICLIAWAMCLVGFVDFAAGGW